MDTNRARQALADIKERVTRSYLAMAQGSEADLKLCFEAIEQTARVELLEMDQDEQHRASQGKP